jgi:cell division septum initiation protein DivIVA
MEILLEKTMNQEDIKKTEEFLENISSIREKLFKLEFDIGQTWLNNLEFKEFLKEITVTWIDIKIEVQQYLADVFQRFNVFQETIHDSTIEISPLKKKITYEFLNTNLQNIIIQAISSQRDVLERFDNIIEPIYKEIKVRRFSEARNLVQITISNLYNSIEDYNREINRIYENIDKINITGTTANEIRKYLNNWSQVKDNLLEKIHSFKNDIDNAIFTEEIKEYLKYINPISIEHLGKILSLTTKELKEKLLPLIQNQTIMAEIEEKFLIQPQKPMEERLLAFFRKVEILGSKLVFSLRVYNPTKFFISDIGMIFIFPEFLQYQKEESDPTQIFIREFEPEAIRVIKWVFRISKNKDKNIDLEKRYELQKFLLNVSYRNPFGEIKSFAKEGEIIL